MLALDLVLAYNNRGVAYSGLGQKMKKEAPRAQLSLKTPLLVLLVETGESRIPSADHSVAVALRKLSVCLARLADTLDWTDHISKHNQRTDH